MAPVTWLGMTADPGELRQIAEVAEAGEDVLGRLIELPSYVLAAESLADPAEVLVPKLRSIAAFLERRRDRVPFGGPELAASIERLNAQTLEMRRRHPEWYKSPRVRRRTGDPAWPH